MPAANALSFESDVKPLFRTRDVNSMVNFGGFNLHKYEDVKQRADSILSRLKDGSMPCDAAWPKDKIATFERWISEGMLA